MHIIKPFCTFQKLAVDLAGVKSATRSCLPVCQATPDVVDGNGMFCCDTDLCNTASSVTSSGFILLLVSSVAAVLIRQ